MTLRPRSVRLRLTLWYAGALAVILLAFAVAVYAYAYRSLNAQVKAQLARDFASVERFARTDPGELGELDEHGVATLFRVDRDGELLFAASAWQRLGFEEAVSRMPSGKDHAHVVVADRRYRIELRTLVEGGHAYRLAAATDEEAAQHALDDLAKILAIASPMALLLAGVGGYILAGRMLAPVAAIARKAREITAERLSERLPIENPGDEFGKLAHVFNHTLARLEDSFRRLRQFTADASHELRTPLTAMRSVGEVALREGGAGILPADSQAGSLCHRYREAIASMLEEVDRLTRLVESLLQLTRADAGRAALKAETLDLGQLVRETVEHLRALAEEKSQVIRMHVADGAIARVDRDTLRQALINLLDNAIKYSPPGGSIDVSVSRDGTGCVQLSVSDAGPGIPPDQQALVFDRFYRVDKARSREAGGVGLGLSIARWAVEANGGRIELESQVGRGSRFRIVLPAE
ncbi:MAG: heavy metal sensor histidine kinase [Phycisphaerales bacterium]|nr:heavy metal sensor histidine kinase [Phycisphaerales bacterium]